MENKKWGMNHFQLACVCNVCLLTDSCFAGTEEAKAAYVVTVHF